MQGSNGLNYNYLKLRKEVGSIVGGEPQLEEKALQEHLSDTNKQATSNVAGRQGGCYILPILEVLASVARDCKRDIYSRFCT